MLARAIKVAANNGAKLIIDRIGASTLECRGIDNVADNQLGAVVRETLKDEMLDVVKPDLVLCGARGLSSIKYALLGSISTFLLRNTDCDILVVLKIQTDSVERMRVLEQFSA